MDFTQAYWEARSTVKNGDESAAIEKYWYNNLLSTKGEWSSKKFVEVFIRLFNIDPRKC